METGRGKKRRGACGCRADGLAGEESYRWLIVHASFVQHAGDFASAVEDWKKIEQFSLRSGIPSRATALNGIAYAQALAKTNLNKALESANEALELARDNPNILDTRGYIHFQREEYADALADLDLAVPGLDKEVELVDKIVGGHSMPPLYRRVVNAKPKRLLEVTATEDLEPDMARQVIGT